MNRFMELKCLFIFKRENLRIIIICFQINIISFPTFSLLSMFTLTKNRIKSNAFIFS